MVVLPQPLLPSRPNVSPRLTLKERFLMTVLPPKEILNFLTSMMFDVVFVIVIVILSFLLHLCFISDDVFAILRA